VKKFSQESINKRVAATLENSDKKEMAKQKMIQEIKEESKGMLLPNLKEKMEKTTELILSLLKEKDISNIQIMSYIAKGSLLENALGRSVGYTPQELSIGFDLYLDMINKINEIKPFPPTVESFANFMGISRDTYNNYLVDADRKDIMSYIHSYLLGVLATSSLTGETKEISSIYLQKSMGKVEQVQPIVVEHKKIANLEDINKRLADLSKDNIINAEYEEKED
jgi:hypothetical protein